MASDYYVYLHANFDLTSFNDAESLLINDKNTTLLLNSVPATQTLIVTPTPVLSSCKLTISSNGIDNGSFLIDQNKFTDSKIYFVVRLKSFVDTYIKQIELLDFPYLSLALVDSYNNTLTGAVFTTNTNDISATGGGMFRGVLTSPVSAANVKIIAHYDTQLFTLSGESNTFNIYPKSGIYDARKVNEDHDQSNTYKSLIFQNALRDSPTLFDAFLGQIVGDMNTSPNTLGIQTYEKIVNFVSNNADVVYANIPAFMSMLDSMGVHYEKYKLDFPPSLLRLLNIFSVPLSNQIGGRNKFTGNFNNKGYFNSQYYGTNKGNELPIHSTLLYSNFYQSKNIIAHEKFSNQYKLVTTFIVNARSVDYIDNTIKSYALSGYNDSWGWGLVLPPGLSGIDIKDYYGFYDFVPVEENSLLQKFIDFDNPNNTYLLSCSSYDEYSKDGGIVDNMITHSLYTNTGILST